MIKAMKLKKRFMMKILVSVLFSFLVFVLSSASLLAADLTQKTLQEKDDKIALNLLAPHKALYDIQLVATHSGSQIINISGKMYYEWKPSCEAWITDHRFDLVYEYADNPSMRVTSDFSTFETFNGEDFNFSARRKRDNTLYQELRGKATIADKGGKAHFTIPEDLDYDLTNGSMFPMAHTLEMIEKAKNREKFFQAVVFDGSDEEGPVEINTFIGNPVNAMTLIKGSDDLDMSLLNTNAWKVRMAVFPTAEDEALSDYEMSIIFHENGIISDMLIDYDDFSVTQKLVALERLDDDNHCSQNKTHKIEKN